MASDNSLITKYRRQILCQATSGEITDPIPIITEIAFGKGGIDADGNPIPPADDATVLNEEVARYRIDHPPIYPISTTAQYVVTIPADELVGVAISEAALVDSAGQLCAIKTMFQKVKDGGVTFTFTFDDEF